MLENNTYHNHPSLFILMKFVIIKLHGKNFVNLHGFVWWC